MPGGLLPPIRTTTSGLLKDTLYSVLSARMLADFGEDTPGNVAPVVSFGMPDESKYTREMVVIGGISSNEDDWAEAIGRGARNENYTITLVISVAHDGDTQQQVTQRAFSLLYACDSAITGVQLVAQPGWCLLKFGRLNEGMVQNKPTRVAEIVAGVQVFARL